MESNAPDDWYPELLKAPGSPLGDCVFDDKTMTFSREWSGVSVSLNIKEESAVLKWKGTMLAATGPGSATGSASGQGLATGPGSPTAPLTFLPITPLGARCLSGSPYGFYHVPAVNTSSTQWTIYLQGGGYCLNEASCWSRAHQKLGNSSFFPPKSECICMNGAVGYDGSCHCLYLPYCDGASFAGFRENPWPINSSNPKGDAVYFRGLANLDDTLDYAFSHLGLDQATEVVLSGGSAGGVATFLHMDRVGDRMGPAVRTTAAPVVGLFLDATPLGNGTGPNSPSGYPPTSFGSWMAYIYSMQNLTSRAEGGALGVACLADHASSPHDCFMSVHVTPYLHTPYFMLNSKVDAWQLMNDLQVPCYRERANYPNHTTPCSAQEQAQVLSYANSYLDALVPVRANPANGAFITSCICHDCPWSSLALGGRTSWGHYADWHAGRTAGAAAVHIDTRGPDGGGMRPPMHPACFKWP
jgi:hypothetical protein